MRKKCIVLFSGGLDSRLAVKIMQEQSFEIICVYFKLPFGCSSYEDVKEFVNKNKCILEVFDCSKGKLLQEYLEYLKNPKYGRGSGANPCKDCKIFMFRKVKEFADEKKIDLVVSGEVLGERPMSQTKNALNLIEKNSGLIGRLLRPLSANLLEETNAEREGLVDREKLCDVQGRKRKKQIELARKFGVNFPHPAGGCLLCEKFLKNRFKVLIDRGMNDCEIKLAGIGRHFLIEDAWIILGRNKEENAVLEMVGKEVGDLIESEIPGPSALVIGNGDVKEKVESLIKAYSKDGCLGDRKRFEKWRL